MKLLVVYGKIDSGKTHTMWLILSRLLNVGARLIEPMYNVSEPLSYAEIMSKKTSLPDFRALVEIHGKIIMLLSAGDYLNHPIWGFKEHMQWAKEHNVDYVICASRSRNIKGSVYRELRDNYAGSMLNDEDWFYVEKRDNASNWLCERDTTAKDVVKHIMFLIGMVHYRGIFPVGHGGFACEIINDFAVIYDCGSSSLSLVSKNVDLLTRCGIKKIDYLFISHFDNDHVNGIQYLLSSGIPVNNAVMSYIPKDLEIVYNIATDDAYNRIRILLRTNEIYETPIEPEQTWQTVNSKWEWIAKSMLENNDFTNLRNQLQQLGIDLTKLNDADYLSDKRTEINHAFKAAFGRSGPNAKGLILLSQRTKNTNLIRTTLQHACSYLLPYCKCAHQGKPYCSQYHCKLLSTSCLYTGDVVIKSTNDITKVNNFLQQYHHEQILEILQLPHHGSKKNIDPNLHAHINADMYYVNDKNFNRIQQVNPLCNDLTSVNKLLLVSDKCSDMILGYSIVL